MSPRLFNSGDLIPDTVCGTGVHIDREGREARVFWLRLPSFGWYFDYNFDHELWGQRVLFYHGRQGFRFFWREVRAA